MKKKNLDELKDKIRSRQLPITVDPEEKKPRLQRCDCGDDHTLDSEGNTRTRLKSELKDGKLYISYHYALEPGATTLRGEHPKLADPPQCVYPQRLSCNYGEGFERCEFMKYMSGRWSCQASSTPK